MRPAIVDGIKQLDRNGRWGTCVDCPRAQGDWHTAFPERCENTDRYDHQLTAEQLVKAIEIAKTRGN